MFTLCKFMKHLSARVIAQRAFSPRLIFAHRSIPLKHMRRRFWGLFHNSKSILN